jgi:hypothetical protein
MTGDVVIPLPCPLDGQGTFRLAFHPSDSEEANKELEPDILSIEVRVMESRKSKVSSPLVSPPRESNHIPSKALPQMLLIFQFALAPKPLPILPWVPRDLSIAPDGCILAAPFD